jgi:hypothetical protein
MLRSRGISGETESVRRTLHERAIRRFGDVWERMRDNHCVLWVDNYYRRRIAANPAVGYSSLSCSVVAALCTRSMRINPPSLGMVQIVRNRVVVAQRLMEYAGRMCDFVQSLVSHQVDLDDVRVPLDIPREHVRSLQWEPVIMVPSNVSENTGFVRVLHMV